MARLEPPKTDEMDEPQRAVHDAIASGPRRGVRGPLAVWLWRPEFAGRAQSLGQYCRYDSSLDPRLSELAILVTARYWSSEYEWQAHKRIALQAGVDAAVIEAIRQSQQPTFTRDDERAVYEFASALLASKRVPQDVYDSTVQNLGRDAVVDLVGVLGYYGLISMTINAFEVDAIGPAELTTGSGSSSTE